MSPRSRRLVAPLAVGALTLCSAAYVGFVDPNQPGHYPLCPTKALTGLDCPGCGGLRATHALVTGDVVGALDHNALVALLIIPLALAAWVAWLVRCWREPAQPVVLANAPVQYAAVGSPIPSPDRDAEHVAMPTRTPSSQSGWADPRLMWAVLALVVVFTVVRNIDAVPALAWLGSGVGTG